MDAQQKDAQAWPLLLDLDGNISEPWGSNFFFVSKGSIFTSTSRTSLEGVTKGTVFELAEELGISVIEGNFAPYDVYNADEAFTTATSYEIQPVCSLDAIKIGDKIPGPITSNLIKSLSKKVGVDIIEQAMSHLNKEERSNIDG